jgi:thiol:disulfide interchange protein DsbD
VGSLQGGAWALTQGMAGFGIALALPFTLFAIFPQWLQSLPKSGGWLDTVKKVLAFLELALAFKFLSNADLLQHGGLLKREVFLGLWALISIGLALYLWGKLQ